MEERGLFPQLGGLLHGGDYNPEQWLDRPDILKEDIRMMKKASINSVTLGVFAWSVYEPTEGEFHLDWMDEIINKLYENGIYTILATPTGGRPVWMDHKYPEVLRVDERGIRRRSGGRHNHCMSSPVFRRKAGEINKELANRFGNHPALLMWHVSNELGGECYCPLCAEKFREYLRKKFEGNIDRLNQAWWTTFWSRRYADFEEIEPPYQNGERGIMGLNLEWKRFTTWNMTDYMSSEIKLLKSISPEIPVTTNFMKLYQGLDYHAMAGELDVISWDSYPPFHNDWENLYDTMAENAFHHTLMRSMKRGKPFMLMESTPSLVNWHSYNKPKRPGIHRLASLQAIACGSDTVQYFQWRKGRGSTEQYHGAVVDHLGRDDTRIFREVEALGIEMRKLREIAGSLITSEAALLFDWDTRWALKDVRGMSKESLRYEETCMSWWRECLRRGVETDIISVDTPFEKYRLVIAPMLYMMKKGVAERLIRFVEEGGILIGTYLMGYVDENQICFLGGFPGGSLKELFGVCSEELDTLYPGDHNSINENGTSRAVQDYAEVLRVGKAKVLAVYEDDFYRESAAVTCNEKGAGKAYYVAARTEADYIGSLLERSFAEAGIGWKALPEEIEAHVRRKGDCTYTFYLNHSRDACRIETGRGWELLEEREVEGSIILPAYGVCCIKRQEKQSRTETTKQYGEE